MKWIQIPLFIIGLFTSSAIGQDPKATLIQEYTDFCLEPPPVGKVGSATATMNFAASEFTKSSDFAPVVVNGGMSDIAQAIRTGFGKPLIISSAYRNPKRNKAVGGVPNSVHMSGGAVDLQPQNTDFAKMVILYQAGFRVAPGMVLLERGPVQLLPGNTNLPVAGNSYSASSSSITFSDADTDGLVESVKSVTGSLASNVPIIINGLTLIVQDANGNSRVDVGEAVLVRYKQDRRLIDIFRDASHVHADNRNLMQIVNGCIPKKP
jgi:Peptidase M15